MPEGLTVVTWNVQGRAGLDPDAAAAALARFEPDVIALQEVQRGQARALSRGLDRLDPAEGHWHGVWGFKHWPVVTRPEGVAVLSRWPVAASRVLVLRPGMPLRSTRRVAVVADCDLGEERTVRVASVHLSPAVADEAWRQRELARVASADPDVVLGDLNVADLSPLHAVLDHHGWADCWDPAAGSGCTHWAGAAPRSGRDPDHRLDYVLAGPSLSAVSAVVPEAGELARLSDHLPVVAHLRLAPI